MEQLTVFEYNGVSIGVYGTKHNPYFAGHDVAQALGYKDKIAALSRYVDMDDKLFESTVTLISEYGLYSLIANSGNRLAKRYFVECVLPQIHKSGKCKKKADIDRKKYVRLYELSSGEKLSKADLKKKALLFGMTKSESNRATAAQLMEYVNRREEKNAEQKMLEDIGYKYPYSYDELDEVSQYNLASIIHVLPEGSYKTVNGISYFSEAAIDAVKMELSRWK